MENVGPPKKRVNEDHLLEWEARLVRKEAQLKEWRQGYLSGKNPSKMEKVRGNVQRYSYFVLAS